MIRPPTVWFTLGGREEKLPIGIRTDGLVIDLVARSEPVDIGKIASLHDYGALPWNLIKLSLVLALLFLGES